jgi:uncharacterized protein YcaQ
MTTMWSPRMQASGWVSPETLEQEQAREIATILEALGQRGPLERAALEDACHGRGWGPLRFRRALQAAQRGGRVAREGNRFRLVVPPGSGPASGPTPGPGSGPGQ